MKIYSQLSKHWLIVCIVLVTTWLRVWQLNSTAILIGDAAHDIQSAISAVENKQLPLLGIESSVPRFKQGPVAVWLHMAISVVAQKNLVWHWVVFAVIGVLAVIATYELGQLYLSPFVAHLASWLVAASPLAIAHSRMAYHITPIPFMTVLFLAAVIRLSQQKKYSLFWAVLSWAGLFQFELATAPLLLVVIFYAVKNKLWQQPTTFWQCIGGLALGLWPQITVDITTSFSHLGGFIAWVGYRIASAAPTGGHQLSLASIAGVGKILFLYITRIFSVNNQVVGAATVTMLAISSYFNWQKFIQGKLPIAIEVTFLATITLLASFVIHGSPSEAYFPPFIIFLPLLLAYTISQLSLRLRLLGVCILLLVGVINIFGTFQSNFFTGNYVGFSYGYSYGEQKRLVQFINVATNNSFHFNTTHPSGAFANYFDNLRLVAWEQYLWEDTTGQPAYIEIPGQTDELFFGDFRPTHFPSVDVFLIPY